jgi:hypothetical protein
MVITLTEIARHEAAHALAGWFFGSRIQQVQLTFDPLAEGRAGGFSFARAQRFVLSAPEVYTVMAGFIQGRLDGHARESCMTSDFLNLRNNLRLGGATLHMLQWIRAHPHGSVHQFIDNFKGPVQRLLRSKKGQKAVKALADALLKHTTLSGASAVKILERAWRKPYPKAALPCSEHEDLLPLASEVKTLDELLDRTRILCGIINDDLETLRGRLTASENETIDRVKKALLTLLFSLDKNQPESGDTPARSFPPARVPVSGK